MKYISLYIKISIIILILLVLYNVFINTNKKEYIESSQKIYALTFGGGGQNYYSR